MLKRLEEIKKRYQELEKELSRPGAAADTSRYRSLLKEHSALRPMVAGYHSLKKLREEIRQVEGLLGKKENGNEEFLALAREELSHLRAEEKDCLQRIQELLLQEEEHLRKNVIVEIRAGTGGEEAALFAADLFRMYTKFAARKHWQTEIMSSHPSATGGFKEIIFSMQGDGVYPQFKFESGTHRVQRVPATESSGRIHTSAVTVAVLPEAGEVDLKINPADLRIDVFRSSGPGGQGVNTTDSAVRLTHIPTGLVVSCQDERSQMKNKIKAMRVLRTRLLEKIRQEEESRISRDRRRQIGSGDRSERIRTYNFPERRVTDHRVGLVLHKLDRVLEGELEELISALMKSEREQKLKRVADETVAQDGQ